MYRCQIDTSVPYVASPTLLSFPHIYKHMSRSTVNFMPGSLVLLLHCLRDEIGSSSDGSKPKWEDKPMMIVVSYQMRGGGPIRSGFFQVFQQFPPLCFPPNTWKMTSPEYLEYIGSGQWQRSISKVILAGWNWGEYLEYFFSMLIECDLLMVM